MFLEDPARNENPVSGCLHSAQISAVIRGLMFLVLYNQISRHDEHPVLTLTILSLYSIYRLYDYISTS